MTKKISTTKQGFTIIEVVLVLAIAGLIFLMVFVAFPALQRNQRDTQRRQDYANLQAAVITAYSDNGSFPTAASGSSLVNSMGDKEHKDPSGNLYSLTIVEGASGEGGVPTAFAEGVNVYVVHNAKCNGNVPAYENNSNHFVVFGKLENGGSYCRDASLK